MYELYPERVRRQIGGSNAIPKDNGLWSQIQVLVRFVCDLQRFGLRFRCFFFQVLMLNYILRRAQEH